MYETVIHSVVIEVCPDPTQAYFWPTSDSSIFWPDPMSFFDPKGKKLKKLGFFGEFFKPKGGWPNLTWSKIFKPDPSLNVNDPILWNHNLYKLQSSECQDTVYCAIFWLHSKFCELCHITTVFNLKYTICVFLLHNFWIMASKIGVPYNLFP